MKKTIFERTALIIITLAAAIIINITGCSKSPKDEAISSWKERGVPGNLKIRYPQANSIFPPEIASPTIFWEDMTLDANVWLVIFDKGGNEEIYSDILKESQWKPNPEQWNSIKTNSQGKEIRLIVLGLNTNEPEKIISGEEIKIKISKDSVKAQIFYRAVPLPFFHALNNLENITWRLGDISSDKPSRIVIENLPVCGNCHSFTPDGKTIGMDIDYANDKGSYIIADIENEVKMTPDKIISWSDYRKEDGEKTFGLLSQISPDGRYALSTIKDRSIFVPKDDMFYSQLFFPFKGRIGVYDRQTKKFWTLPGADDPKYVQSNPNWSPDGKYILFARAPYIKIEKAERAKEAVLPTEFALDFIEGRRGFKFDIYRIDFNEGKGGVAMPLQGASSNGKSNYFPRFSPDGKWLVFTQAKNFMLLQPDAKLYIMPAKGGTPRLMNCNNADMNSWHSWSPNGKWLVFSSKVGSAYTKMYITHIDENGIDSPPILLENFSVPERAVNIPEFVNIKPGKAFKMIERFMQADYYAEVRGNIRAKMGDMQGALRELDDAIKLEPNYAKHYYNRGLLNIQLKDFKNALISFNKSIELDPKDFMAYYERGYVKVGLSKYYEAIDDFNNTLKLNPDYFMAFYERGIAKYYLENYPGAIADYSEAIRLKPDAKYAFYQRGLSNIAIKNYDEGCKDLNKSYELGCQEAYSAIQDYCKGR